MMTTLFVVLPGMLLEVHALQLPQHWKVYVPTMLVSVLLVFPLIRWASMKQAEQSLMPWAFALLSVPFALFSTELSLVALGLAVVAYFLAFNLLEAVMPSLVSRRASPAGRGRKMGRFATFQFLGVFAGGVLGGGLMQSAGPEATMLAAALVCIAWAWVSRIVLKAGNRAL
jgi:predicted MFS family arabinose efflux permease